MLKTVLSASLAATFFIGSIGGITPSPGPSTSTKDYTFEITEETDFGLFYEGSKKEMNTFELPLTIGNAYNYYSFDCEAFVYAVNPDGTYDAYPDNGSMKTDDPLVVFISSGNTIGYFTATFTTTFFGNTTYCSQWTDILLVFQMVGTPNSIDSDDECTFTFYTRTVQAGLGEYTIAAGTKEFYPYDDHIVFGGDRPNGNITETVDFSETTNALCEEKYLSLSENFKISFKTNLPDDNDSWGSPGTMSASICVKDPEYYFPDMHDKNNPNFQISLLSDYTFSGVEDYSETLSATFDIGGKTYWVNPNTLEMSLSEKPRYKETDQFYFRVGYFDEIRENCEFYLRAKGVGHNEATYNIKLDFLGNHNYFGSCVDSDYCMHYGRG